MQVVFVSNYFNHHQKPLCDALFSALGENFVFLATSVMREERKKLGYQFGEAPSYVRETFTSKEEQRRAKKLIDSCDVCIIGSAPDKLFTRRIYARKVTFRYTERPFKTPLTFRRALHVPLWHLRYPCFSRVFLLCAGWAVADDYQSVGLFKNRAFRFGYFPKTETYEPEDLFSKKETNRILFCGRLIDWKHPDDALSVAARLKAEGYSFTLDFLGVGEMLSDLQERVEKEGLTGCVNLLGSVPHDRVRGYMEKAGIYLFLSDRKEGWGAVCNEAMNSGCAVVANRESGSAPFLAKENENALLFENGDVDALYNHVKDLLDHPEKQREIGENAYRTIKDVWNASVAAERLLAVSEALLEKKSVPEYDFGPLSRVSGGKR